VDNIYFNILLKNLEYELIRFQYNKNEINILGLQNWLQVNGNRLGIELTKH
jgi:hypothetical protein